MSTIQPSFQMGGVNGWKGKEGAVLGWQQTGGNLFKPAKFDFTRLSGSASYVDENGLIQIEHRPNYPRFTWQDGKQCLMNEESRTNLFTYSNDFTNAAWSKALTGAGLAPVVTANFATSPDGTTNAARIQFDAGGATASDRSILRQVLTRNTNNHTISFYVKSNSGAGNQTIAFNFKGLVESPFTVSESEWTRVEYTDTGTASSGTYGLELKGDVTDQTADVLVYGAQFEEASEASSYIPTEGSAVTRAGETGTEAVNLENFCGDAEGTIRLKALFFDNTSSSSSISLSDGTADNRILIQRSTSGSLIVQLRSGGTQQCLISAGSQSPNVFYDIVFKYKEDDFEFWLDGVSQGTETSGVTFAADTLNELQLDVAGSSADFVGLVEEVKLYDQALNYSQL